MYRVILAAKTSPLYHGTTFENAISIIETNELRGNVSNETETYGVSLTRNKDSAYDEVALILDQEKLSYNYKISPIYREGISGRDLAEERITRTITNIRSYLLGLQWNNRIYVKSIRRMLVDNFEDESILEPASRKGPINMVWRVNRLIALAHKYNIPLDDYFKEVEKYLTMFKNREYDEEYAKILEAKRNAKKG